MIDVEVVKINVRMPSDEVRIVAMQPFVKFYSTTQEPFIWPKDAENAQLSAINRTLDIAQIGFRSSYANFTLFPEYSIPGIIGVTDINNRISSNDWPNGSIIIAGIQGLLKDEYNDMCNILQANVSLSDRAESIPNNNWVNCCIIWVKDSEGVVKKWVQLKVRPSWPEKNVNCNDMFCGTTVYVFECQYDPYNYPCRFVTLICFDWVVYSAGTTVRHELLTKLNQIWTQSQPALDWVFVIQHNKAPNHNSFLNGTVEFLTDPSYAFVQRDKAIVIHANSAVDPLPMRSGERGFSACIFSPSAQFDCSGCRPTICMRPNKLRNSDILKRCTDVVFREMGECIHAFKVSVPRFLRPDPTNKTLPLPEAYVYSTSESNDPRLSNGPVAASVKWVNDTLDNVNRLSENDLAKTPIRGETRISENAVIERMRRLSGHNAIDYINWATSSYSQGIESRGKDKNRCYNADLWEKDEDNALEHVLHSLTAIGLAYCLEYESAIRHGAIHDNEGFIQIVAIRGDTHEDCRLHYDNLIPKLSTDPVLVIARDRNNLIPTIEEYLRIDETQADSGLVFLGYQTLITICRQAADTHILKELLNDIFPKQRRII